MSARLAGWLVRDAWSSWHALRAGADQLDAVARRRLARLLEHARGIPFYAERMREAGVAHRALVREPFAALAAMRPVQKGELRDAGTAVLAGGRVDPGWYWSSSSGSTGEPFRVYYDARAWALLKYHVKLRARAACGVRPTDRVALLDAIPPEEEGRTALERIGRVARISVLQPAERVARRLAEFRPDAIYALPSTLLEIAERLGEMPRPARPVAIFTSGELLQDAQRARLAAAFGAPVFDVYGTSETKELAWECRDGGRHINADVARVEVLDEAGLPVRPGEEGDIVATLLVNRAMPLLRYRTGDRGALDPHPCRCGRAAPLLGVVAGRTVDTLELGDGLRISPYTLTCALERVPELRRYQVTQTEPSRLRVRAVVPEGTDPAGTGARIRAVLRELVHAELVVDVEYVDRLATGPRAKLRVVEPWRAPPDAPVM